MQNDLDPKGHDPKLVAALASLVKRLEATPEGLRGPFLVKGLKPYLSATVPAEGELTVDEVEKIILETEPPQLSDRSDKIWTRRMATALASRLSQGAGVRVTDEMVERFASELWTLDDAYARSIPHSKIRAALEAALSSKPTGGE